MQWAGWGWLLSGAAHLYNIFGIDPIFVLYGRMVWKWIDRSLNVERFSSMLISLLSVINGSFNKESTVVQRSKVKTFYDEIQAQFSHSWLAYWYAIIYGQDTRGPLWFLHAHAVQRSPSASLISNIARFRNKTFKSCYEMNYDSNDNSSIKFIPKYWASIETSFLAVILFYTLRRQLYHKTLYPVVRSGRVRSGTVRWNK